MIACKEILSNHLIQEYININVRFIEPAFGGLNNFQKLLRFIT